MTKRFGFTLAEVLITLGIIGVVAAMTIPTLMQNTSDAQFKTAFKKSLSVMNQAVLMQLAMEDTDFSNIVAEDSTDNENTTGSMAKLLNARMNSATDITGASASESGSYKAALPSEGIIIVPAQEACASTDATNTEKPHCTGAVTEAVTEVKVTPSSTNFRVYQFADNTAFGYLTDDEGCTETAPCHGWIDVNGAKRPNQLTTISGTGANATVTINDIFPVTYFDQTVRPDAAGVAVLGQ